MGKEFKKKYMHPTRRKLLDMVKTGEYDKNTTIGYSKAKETHEVGDIWEDDHHNYEKKDGYIIKTGKNHEQMQEIRKFLEEKSKCKNSDCKTIKNKHIDTKFIKNGGYCMNCTIDREHVLKTKGVFDEYAAYKVWTRAIVFGKAKVDSYKQSIDELKEEYEMMGSDGKITETWRLPKPIDEVKSEIQELIDKGNAEIQELEDKRILAFEKLRDVNLEHYL